MYIAFASYEKLCVEKPLIQIRVTESSIFFITDSKSSSHTYAKIDQSVLSVTVTSIIKAVRNVQTQRNMTSLSVNVCKVLSNVFQVAFTRTPYHKVIERSNRQDKVINSNNDVVTYYFLLYRSIVHLFSCRATQQGCLLGGC